MDEVTSELARQWAAVSSFEMAILQLEYFAYEIALIDEDGTAISGDELPADVLESARRDLTNTGLIRKRGAVVLISAAELCYFVDRPRELVNENSDPVRVKVGLSTRDNDWYVETVSGEKRLSQVQVGYEFSIRKLPASIDSIKQYSSTDKPIMELIQGATTDRHGSYQIEASVRMNRPLPSPPTKTRRKKMATEK